MHIRTIHCIVTLSLLRFDVVICYAHLTFHKYVLGSWRCFYSLT
jgi:hypothetical protein